MGYFNFYFLKKLLFKIFTKKMLIYIIIFLLIIIIKSKVFAVTSMYDVEREMVDKQTYIQNNFAMHCVQPFINKTDYWYNCLLPIFEDIDSHDKNFNVSFDYINNRIRIIVRTYDFYPGTSYQTTYTSYLDGQSYNVNGFTFPGTNIFTVLFDPITNTGTLSIQYNQSFSTQSVVARIKSEFLLHFIQGIYEPNTSILLNDISNYLDSIETIDTNILSSLTSITSSLSTIENNTSTNYSQQIGQISSKISDILSDNDTIISQNTQMIQEQQEINDNLEQLSDDVQDVKDTIIDDTVESSASDLPSTDVQDPTQNGIDNIFQSIYNAFCTGEAQDIVFPIPFTNKNITLSPYYVRDMLNNNNAGWIYNLIQAFWGYLIGRYIVSDISKKIDKIKSGNIENVENSNIKEEML